MDLASPSSMGSLGTQSSDEFLATFRTSKCKEIVNCPRGQRCRYSHNTWWQRRRVFHHKKRSLKYSHFFCPDTIFSEDGNIRQTCRRAEKCPYSHSREERDYHPLFYKTLICESFHEHGYCGSAFCPFIHCPNEDRRGRRYEIIEDYLRNDGIVLTCALREEWNRHGLDIVSKPRDPPEQFASLSVASPTPRVGVASPSCLLHLQQQNDRLVAAVLQHQQQASIVSSSVPPNVASMASASPAVASLLWCANNVRNSTNPGASSSAHKLPQTKRECEYLLATLYGCFTEVLWEESESPSSSNPSADGYLTLELQNIALEFAEAVWRIVEKLQQKKKEHQLLNKTSTTMMGGEVSPPADQCSFPSSVPLVKTNSLWPTLLLGGGSSKDEDFVGVVGGSCTSSTTSSTSVASQFGNIRCSETAAKSVAASFFSVMPWDALPSNE